MSARIEPKIEWKEIIELVWIVHAWVRPRGSPVRAHKWKGNLPLVEQAKHPNKVNPKNIFEYNESKQTLIASLESRNRAISASAARIAT